KCPFDDCEKSFPSPGGVWQHIMVHSDERPFKCPVETCFWEFKTPSALNAHETAHKEERRFRCARNNCLLQFKTLGCPWYTPLDAGCCAAISVVVKL
ncbi:hypothetical protein V8F06_014534, partial [Rhypophila decipiens]